MKIYLAFQKQPDNNIISKLLFYIIKWYTRFRYTHVEIFFDDIYISSTYNNGVKVKELLPLSNKYDYFELEVDGKKKRAVLNFIRSVENSQYDWKGIFLSQFIKLKKHNKNKYFCSELCADIIKKFGHNLNQESHTYSPKTLFLELEPNLVSKHI